MSATAVPTAHTGLRARFLWLTDYHELLRTLLRRELRAKYKGSGLGILWSYMHPLLMMGVYTLVFSILWRAVDIPHYPLFV
ncbi:MAG: ABC transporter permease, partial [Actinomycetota bacterium]|nr:ABC transporter permease [Actinomycetota bacterium]